MKSITLSHFGRASMAASIALILTAAPTAGVIAAGGSQTVARDDGIVMLSLGQSKIINLTAAMSDVIVANPDVMDVHVRSKQQLYLIPKSAGQTDVTVTSAAGRVLYRAMVRVGNNMTNVDQMLKVAMPDADITITKMNNMMLLTGTVATPEDMAEAERLVSAFAGDKTTIVSRLKTATPLAVNLQVRIAEVSKSISKSIGMNLATADLTGGFKFALGQGRTIPSQKWIIGGGVASGGGIQNITDPAGNLIGTGVASATSGTTFATDGKLFGLNILAALDLAEDQGLASTLANPNLTAISGETASFLAGGELPIPLATGLGQVSVEFKSYGVSLSFTPTVLADGRISMRVRPEVSDLDYTAGVTFSGTAIPGVKTRRAETTLELGSGQSFMIGGLMRSENSNSINKAPFLGDIPILGNLFKSSAFRRQQTELVIVVTPYLVEPVNARDIKLPTDGFRNANDVQRILGTMTHDSKAGEGRPVPTMAPPLTVPAGSVATSTSVQRRSGKTNAAPGFSF